MKPNYHHLIKIYGFIVIIIFFLFNIFTTINTFGEIISISSKSITVGIISIFIYEKYLWKFNPLIKIPKLKKDYQGKIEYICNDIKGEKSVNLVVKQSFLNVSISLKSDEINSKTITSEIVQENNQFVLYYTYITYPSSIYLQKNPMKLGTCRLVIIDKNNIQGTYWTNGKTIGDIYLKSKEM